MTRLLPIGLLVAAITGACIASAPATELVAQADSVGGSIGGSIGGSFGGSIEVSPGAPAARRAPRARPVPDEAAPVQRRAAARPRPSFDGAWSVSSGGGCSAAGTSQVTISGGRVISQAGVTGHVSPSGAVNTMSSYNGLTVVGRGQITGQSAQGVYRQSDGCQGTWSAVKL